MNRLVKIAAAIGIFGVVAAAGVWYFVIRSDAPPPVSLQSALDAAATSTSNTPGSTTSGATTTSATTSSDGNLTGEWTLVSDGTSFAGYRVEEELVGVGATTAVGRTTAITGTLQFDGTQITSVEVTADVTKLTSDKTMRDGQLRTQALQTNTYPTATFELTSPITIASVPDDGEVVTQTIEGNLTLHGVTNAISIEVQGVLQDGRLVVVGSTVIQFSDYDIGQPSSQSVLSIADNGIMELQLIFEQA